MTMENTPAQQNQVSQDVAPVQQVQRASRRKFLMQAGVGSLPVVMSLKSGDAWGCVSLDCKGGEGNWSGTKSAVQSVGRQQQANYQIPKIFDSLSKIIRVVNEDLGLLRTSGVTNGFDYLWNDIKRLRYRKSKNNYPLVYTIYNSNISSLTAANVESWIAEVEKLNGLSSGKSQLFIGSDTSASRTYITDIKRNLLRPLIHDNKIIMHNTKVRTFFRHMESDKDLLVCLNSGSNFEKFFIGAFVGSLWQKCYIWDTDIGRTYTKHRPDCYPTISELMSAYNSVIMSSPSPSVALEDMGNLFKAYTKDEV